MNERGPHPCGPLPANQQINMKKPVFSPINRKEAESVKPRPLEDDPVRILDLVDLLYLGCWDRSELPS